MLWVFPAGEISKNVESGSGGFGGRVNWNAARQVLFAANLRNYYTIRTNLYISQSRSCDDPRPLGYQPAGTTGTHWCRWFRE